MLALLCAALAALVAVWAKVRRRARKGSPEVQGPRVIGGLGAEMRDILRAVPMLSRIPSTPLSLPGALQLLIFGIQILWEEMCFEKAFEFIREEIVVTLSGESAGGHADRVAVQWLQAERGRPHRSLPADAPIILLCPGLNCNAASLPGTSMYKALLARPWRVGVFEKRGAVQGLRSPAFHLFGHPSDLHTAILRIQARWPSAPIHLVGLSSGNGLVGSYATMYAQQVPMLRSCLLLIGGEDYNLAFDPPRANWLTRVVFDKVLREYNEEGFVRALAADTLQELYNLTMLHFSGYRDRAEAERRINGFSGSNKCLLDIAVPFLVVYTEDDPVAPGGPRDEWTDVVSRCERAAIALYPSGSHLGCYDGWALSRWVDKLAVEWIEAADACLERRRAPDESPTASEREGVKAL